MGFSSFEGQCELVSSYQVPLEDRKGSIVVWNKCFELDLVQLEQSLIDMRKITDIGFKRDAMRERLADMNRTLRILTNEPENFYKNGQKIKAIQYNFSGEQIQTVYGYGCAILILMAIATVFNIFTIMDKFNSCQRFQFGVISIVCLGVLCASYIQF